MSGFQRYRSDMKNIRKLTSQVRITDSMAAPSAPKVGGGNYLGEFGFTNNNANVAIQGDLIARIGDHIEFLAEMANKEHENDHLQKNLQNEFVPKPGHEIDVSRFGMPEFSLYPKDRPITLEEYRTLLERIKKIAGSCHDNLHLVLSSVPVEWPDKKVYNLSVYVQCGKDPILTPFAKSIPSAIDAIYPNTTNPSFVGSSYYPKVLSEGIKLTMNSTAYQFDNYVTWITNGGWNAPTCIDALNDVKAALLNDKYCLPSAELIDCIDKTILAFQNTGTITSTQKDTFIQLMNQFKKNAIEESNRFNDAANLIPPKPFIISNGITTEHYGRFSFDDTLVAIESCKGNLNDNAKALQILETTKEYINKGLIYNSSYTVDAQLTIHIDALILKMKTNTAALDTIEVNKFKTLMTDYKKSCQDKYSDNWLKIQRPPILKEILKPEPNWYVGYDSIVQNVQANSTMGNWIYGKKLLETVRDNITQYNANNAYYRPDSQHLLNHINLMITFYKMPYFGVHPSAFVRLNTLLENYRKDTESRYSSYVRPLMSDISSPIGNTANYAEEFNLTKIASLIDKNLTQENFKASKEQLDYLRNMLLFSNKERSKENKHPLLTSIDNIYSNIDKLDLVAEHQRAYNLFNNIDTFLNKTLPKEEDIVEIYKCLTTVQEIIKSLNNRIPSEKTEVIVNKINDLDKLLPFNPTHNPENFKDLKVDEQNLTLILKSFKEGYSDLGKLLTALPSKYKISTEQIKNLNSEIDYYSKERLENKIENAIGEYNSLLPQGVDYGKKAAEIIRVFSYLNHIENLSPECKKAITAIIDKLEKGNTIDKNLIKELKERINLQSDLIQNMPYWHFPTHMLSQDINYNTSIKCRTNGFFWGTNGNVCLDNLYAIGRRNALHQLQNEEEPSIYHSEIIASNSVNIEPAHAINPTGIISHMDVTTYENTNMGPVSKISSNKVYNTLMGTRDLSTGQTLGVNQLTVAGSVVPKNSSYKTTVNSSNPSQLVINEPIFGPPLVMRKYVPHLLQAIPIANNQQANADTYTANFYVKQIKTLLKNFQLPKEAVQQQQCLDDFVKDLNKLRNNPATTAKDFYKALADLEDKVKLIPSNQENIEAFKQQINSLRHFCDTKLLSVESYISFRCIDQLTTPLTVEQKKVADLFKIELDKIEKTPLVLNNVTGYAEIPAKEIAKAVFDFKKEINRVAGLPEDTAELMKVYNLSENYLRKNFPEIYLELVKMNIPEFAKVINLVESMGPGLTTDQLAAVTALKNAIVVIQRQPLQFDKQGRAIFETFDLEKAFENYNKNVAEIKGEDTTQLKELGEKIDKHLKVLQTNFKLLNLGKEYYDEQIKQLQEKQKKVNAETNLREMRENISSLEGFQTVKKKDNKTDNVEKTIYEKFEEYLKVAKISQRSPHYILTKQLVERLKSLENATTQIAQKPVELTNNEVVNLLVTYKAMLANNFMVPSLNDVHREVLADLKKNYPDVFNAYTVITTKSNFVQDYNSVKKEHETLKSKIIEARANQEKLEKIDQTLPDKERLLILKKEECRVLNEQLVHQEQLLNKLSEAKEQADNNLKGLLKNQQSANEALSQLKVNKTQLEEENDNIREKILKIEKMHLMSQGIKEIYQNIDSLSEYHRRNADEINTIKVNILKTEQDITQLKNKIPDKTRRLDELKSAIDECQRLMAEKEKRLNLKGQTETEQLGKDITDLTKRIAVFQAEFDKLDINIKEMNQEISQLKLKSAKEGELIQTLIKDNNGLDQKIETLKVQIQQKQSELFELAKKDVSRANEMSVKQYNDSIFELTQSQMSLLKQSLSNNSQTISKNQEVILSKEQELQNIEKQVVKGNLECQTCKERLQEHTEVVNPLKTVAKEQNLQLQKLDEEVQGLSSEKEKLKVRLNGEKTSIKYLTTQMEQVDSKFRVLDSQMERHKEQQSELNKNVVKSKQENEQLVEKERAYTQRRNGM